MLEAKHFTGTTESLHNFIGDEHNSVLITERTESLHEGLVHLKPSVGSGDHLENNSSNFVRSFEKNLIMEGSKAPISSLLLTFIIPRPVEWEGIHHLHKSSLCMVNTPGTRITSSGKGSRSTTMIRTVA